MNSQREVIYTRRKNALFGERLDLDILNMIYDTAEDIAINAKNATDYQSFRLNSLSTLGLDSKIKEEQFNTIGQEELGEKLYNEALSAYHLKNDNVRERSLPIMKNILRDRGATFKEVQVPFSDGQRQVGVVVNLEKTVETEGREMIKEMEKLIALAIIDQNWKEHLRELDDLKQSVRMAVHEQKDPLLIYKFESFNLFKQFVTKVNEDTVSFLSKAEIPAQDPNDVQEARRQRTKQEYKESKEESGSALAGGANRTAPVEKTAPIKSNKTYGRNDRVTVQYTDGSMKENVKFKNIETDIVDNKCVVVDS
jgi:preprotein translocase subunit SecA